LAIRKMVNFQRIFHYKSINIWQSSLRFCFVNFSLIFCRIWGFVSSCFCQHWIESNRIKNQKSHSIRFGYDRSPLLETASCWPNSLVWRVERGVEGQQRLLQLLLAPLREDFVEYVTDPDEDGRYLSRPAMKLWKKEKKKNKF
jgi:hypothetical protein